MVGIWKLVKLELGFSWAWDCGWGKGWVAGDGLGEYLEL